MSRPVGFFSGLHLVAVAGLLCLVFVAGRLQFTALDLSDIALGRLGELLAVYVFVALLIERAVELVVNWRYGSEEIAILAPLRQAAARSAAESEMLARDFDLLVSPQDRMTLVDENFQQTVLKAREKLSMAAGETRLKLEGLRQSKKKLATLASFGIAVGLAVSGFQLLHATFGVPIEDEVMNALQMDVFRFVDIIITAIVLAGGAEGIHQLMKAVTGFGGASKTGILKEV